MNTNPICIVPTSSLPRLAMTCRPTPKSKELLLANMPSFAVMQTGHGMYEEKKITKNHLQQRQLDNQACYLLVDFVDSTSGKPTVRYRRCPTHVRERLASSSWNVICIPSETCVENGAHRSTREEVSLCGGTGLETCRALVQACISQRQVR